MRSILKEINSTFLVLIPKKPGEDSMDLFRPISLCNSLYKIISKFLTSRLLKILPIIISKWQTDFFPGRQILDSIMMVHEVIHSLEASKREGMFLKLDLSKAYDWVDWDFLEKSFMPLGLIIKYPRLSLSLLILLLWPFWSMVLLLTFSNLQEG